jgi:hypothetical protein
MFDADTAPQAPPVADDDPAVLRAEDRLRALKELREIGLEIARALGRDVAAGEPRADDKGKSPAEAFGPLSRAIRLTVTLEAKTDAELRDLRAGVVRERAEEQVRAAERDRIAAETAKKTRRKRAYDLVLNVADFEIPDSESFGELELALDERLECDEAYRDAGTAPLRETVERLCRDLGLHPDWSRWDGEGWTAEGKLLRARCSVFNQVSRTSLLDNDWAPLQPAAPTPSLQNGHDLE